MSQTARVMAGLVAGARDGHLRPARLEALGVQVAAAGDAVGKLWLNALQMTVVPLVLALVIVGVNQASDAAQSGRVARRAILTFVVLIASQRGITPQVIATDGDTAAHVAAVAAALRAASGTVLVVGHGNTVSRIIAAVGGPVLPDLCEDRYAQVFVLTGLGATPHLQRWQYGAVDPPAGKDCL